MGETSVLIDVRGIFYRAIDRRFRAAALAGSRAPGRYSRSHQPTLYLSATREGVEAAMIAHRGARAAQLDIVAVEVTASRIADLRNTSAMESLGIDPSDATAPWQEKVEVGETPPSWHVRDRLVSAGAQGLIDPSRKRPPLWHLVLFRWNVPDGPSVQPLGAEDGFDGRGASRS
ncbi:RES family NAD+ phosphorylase [Microbacterium sp. JZ70]